MRRISMTGKKYGRLTVLREIGNKVDCRCDCGNETTPFRLNVLAGYTQSCGCLQKQRASETNFRHGMKEAPIYYIWQAMNRRCYNPSSHSYPWYGAKGIIVCERWRTFQNFLTDMEAGYEVGLTLDRIDSKGNYEPGNCRWLSKGENARLAAVRRG